MGAVSALQAALHMQTSSSAGASICGKPGSTGRVATYLDAGRPGAGGRGGHCIEQPDVGRLPLIIGAGSRVLAARCKRGRLAPQFPCCNFLTEV